MRGPATLLYGGSAIGGVVSFVEGASGSTHNIRAVPVPVAIDGPDDTGRGRWIPTTSVDEYAATLATWFGVSATDLPTVLPNIGRFAKPNLGFL